MRTFSPFCYQVIQSWSFTNQEAWPLSTSLCLYECMQAGKQSWQADVRQVSSHQSTQIIDLRPASVSHHHRHPPLRMSASPRCCRHGNTGPAGAAAPGPPRSRPFRAPVRGNWGPRGGCRKCWHRDASRTATGRVQAPTGGRSWRVQRRRQGPELQRQGRISL